MTEKCKRRIKNILNHYHPKLEPGGEESITYEQAVRMVDYFMAMGYDEDKAMEGLKYCLTGCDFDEGEWEDKEKLELKLDEICFNSNMAMRKASHAGLLSLALYVMHKAQEKKENNRVAIVVLVVAMGLFLWDDVEILIRAVKKLVQK
ncbi:MAG: hypothetical protein LUE24_10935 [Lachnospiraceae bacterium]|nr:hypothetical protein [Lachnospiraceae bacterium]